MDTFLGVPLSVLMYLIGMPIMIWLYFSQNRNVNWLDGPDASEPEYQAFAIKVFDRNQFERTVYKYANPAALALVLLGALAATTGYHTAADFGFGITCIAYILLNLALIYYPIYLPVESGQ